MRLGPEFHQEKSKIARPAPAALPLSPQSTVTPGQSNWTFPRESIETDETDLKMRGGRHSPMISPHDREPAVLTPRRMSFFDVGGLLGEDQVPSRARRSSTISTTVPPSLSNFSLSPLINSSTTRHRSPRGSRILLNDLGGILDSRRNSRVRDESRRNSRAQSESRRNSKANFSPGPG